jgi:BirA family biotin operon repressor/biotin-[acetyl-CoA-carboxylase] ligase
MKGGIYSAIFFCEEKEQSMIQEISKNLKTEFIGREILFYSQIDSTQKEAKRLIQDQNIKDGTIILTDNQISGIGTKDRVWFTGESNNIAFTLILFPNCGIDKLNNFTIIIANCIIKAIKGLYGFNLDLKYPNDVILNNKKIGGILTESTVNNGIAKQLLIGVGFNVNETDFPEELKKTATSLAIEYNKRCSRELIIAEICNILEKEYIGLLI